MRNENILLNRPKHKGRSIHTRLIKRIDDRTLKENELHLMIQLFLDEWNKHFNVEIEKRTIFKQHNQFLSFLLNCSLTRQSSTEWMNLVEIFTINWSSSFDCYVCNIGSPSDLDRRAWPLSIRKICVVNSVSSNARTCHNRPSLWHLFRFRRMEKWL